MYRRAHFGLDICTWSHLVDHLVANLWCTALLQRIVHLTSGTTNDDSLSTEEHFRFSGALIFCRPYDGQYHNNDVIMSTMASQITSLAIVCSTVYSGADQRKHESSASLAFVRGIHRWPVNSPAQRASNAENISIWWRHNDNGIPCTLLGFAAIIWLISTQNDSH